MFRAGRTTQESEHFGQVRQGVRLVDNVLDPEAPKLFELLGRGVAAEDDYRELPIACPDRSQDRDSVHSGQRHIEEYGIRTVPRQFAKTFLSGMSH